MIQEDVEGNGRTRLRFVDQQAAERRLHILETTRRLLESQGYEALTMRELARECRVSVPTLYRQFEDKQALVREAVQDHFRGAILGPALADSALRGHRRVLRILDLCGEQIRRLPGYYRELMGLFMAETTSTQGQSPQLSSPIHAELIGELSRALEQMHEDDELQPWVNRRLLAERIASEAMLSAVQWASGMLSAEGYHASFVYSSCMLLLGGCQGAAVDELRERAQGVSGAAHFCGP